MFRDTFVDLAGSLLDRLFEKGCADKQHALRTANAEQTLREPNIFRRDVCTDAFGTGWSSNTCTPGNTLCCVKDNASMPTCSQHLGIGWCCTAEGGCYADLSSSCGQPGAVSCTELGEGVDEACCPRYTTCAKGYNATESFVRCDIRSTSLADIAASSTALSGASTQTSTSSVASSTSTSPTTSSSISVGTSTDTSTTTSASSSSAALPSTYSIVMTPTPNALPKAEPSQNVSSSSSTTPSSQPTGILLSTGEIAGIVVASAGGVLLLVALSWVLRRRNRSRRKKFAMPTTPMTPSFGRDSKRASPIMLQSQHGFSELSGSADPVELQSTRWSRKQVRPNKHVSVAGTWELGS
ncbi:hypothetical protein D6D20_06667 [Aureobasidium pullulans]|uniref:Mid2 domain-containing protein n=1 Tax=Aureobasidium pullulans TaxID=5580 RepID=A0A4S8YYL3_AURPU|nr:hypothetical protein D6D20_06667 [Aureobasidium pullulans]